MLATAAGPGLKTDKLTLAGILIVFSRPTKGGITGMLCRHDFATPNHTLIGTD